MRVRWRAQFRILYRNIVEHSGAGFATLGCLVPNRHECRQTRAVRFSFFSLLLGRRTGDQCARRSSNFSDFLEAGFLLLGEYILCQVRVSLMRKYQHLVRTFTLLQAHPATDVPVTDQCLV